MKLTLTPSLQHHLGLIPLQLKGQKTAEPVMETDIPIVAKTETNKRSKTNANPVSEVIKTEITAPSAHTSTTEHPVSMPKPELEKNEFRLLVKILKAIGHECIFNQIEHSDNKVIYHHPSKDLVFHNITSTDDEKHMNLSSLKDMNSDIKLKRAVWEKLKSLS